MNKSLLMLFSLSGVLLAVHFLTFQALNLDFGADMLIIYAVLVGITALFDHLMMVQKDPKKFVNLYMGYSGGKLMLSLFILAVYAFINKEGIIPFAISFLVVYFLLTGFEIQRLLRHLKN